VVNSPAWPALVAGLRHAHAQGLDASDLLSDSINRADLTGAHDTAAVLHPRLDARTRAARRKGLGHDPATLAGMITPAAAPDDPTMARLLSETEDLIVQRAAELAQSAITKQEPWLARLGPMPTRPETAAAWEEAVTIVAGYRDRHGVTSVDPVGPSLSTHDHSRRRDHAQATAAIESARAISALARRTSTTAPMEGTDTGVARSSPGLTL
jgi:hypothetical protein